MPDEFQTGSMAGLPDINEGWRSRIRGRRARREKGEALVGKTWLDPEGCDGCRAPAWSLFGPDARGSLQRERPRTSGSRDFRGNPIHAGRWLSDRGGRADWSTPASRAGAGY